VENTQKRHIHAVFECICTEDTSGQKKWKCEKSGKPDKKPEKKLIKCRVKREKPVKK